MGTIGRIFRDRPLTRGIIDSLLKSPLVRQVNVFRDGFEGASIDTIKWPTQTDTGGNISVSGGELRFAGGASNWTGTLLTGKPITPVAGLTLDWDIIWSNLGTVGGGMIIGVDDITPIAIQLAAAFFQRNTVLTIEAGAGVGPILPITCVADTRYYFRLVFLDPGLLFYVATSPSGPYSPLWYSATGFTGTYYPGYANNDAIGTSSAMKAYRRTVPSPLLSVASPTMGTPTLGAELLTDPGLETWTTATDLTNWTENLAGTTTINREATTKHGGTYAARMDVDASNNLGEITQDVTGVVNTWYTFSAWLNATVDKNVALILGNSNAPVLVIIPGSSWGQYQITGRATIATLQPKIDRSSNGASASIYIDDLSLKANTLASLFSLVGDPGIKAGLFDCVISALSAASQAGLAVCLDSETNPLYYLHLYHDGTNFHLDKVENGVPIALIDTAQTWGATVRYRLSIYGSAIAAYADNTKIGATQTVDTTSNYGTKVATFRTNTTNVVDTVAIRGGM